MIPLKPLFASCPRWARGLLLCALSGWAINQGLAYAQAQTAQPTPAQNPVVQEALNQLAEVQRLITAAKYDEALPLAERALATLQQALWAEAPEVATALTRLATIHRNKAVYPKALELNTRALNIADKVPPPGHPEIGQILTEMGVIQQNLNDQVNAETSFLRALSIWRQTLGPTHANVIRAVGNLVQFYGRRNDFAKARQILLPVLEAAEAAVGREHPSLLPLLINLGSVYFQERDLARAEPPLQRALAIFEKTPNQETLNFAGTLNTLGAIQAYKGEFAQAEQTHRRALAMRERLVGAEHPDVASSLFNIASLYVSQGIKFAEAEALQQRALGIYEKTRGQDHPDVALGLNNLARNYTVQSNFNQAVTTQTRATDVSERGLAYNLASGSERSKQAFLTTFANETDRTISLHAIFAPTDAAARSLALTTILRRKGRALDAMIDSLATLRKRAAPEDRVLLDQLRDTRAQIARLALTPAPQPAAQAAQQTRLRTLNEQREKLEDQISRRSAEFRVQAQPVTLEVVKAAIPERAALVEYFVYRPFNPKWTKIEEQFGAPHYVAYVVQRTGEERWVELGDKETIDAAVERARQALRDRKRRDAKRLARAVDKLVMQPIRPLLGTARRVLLAPDGALNLIPFAALVDERNQYLVGRYTFSYLTSGRDLLRRGTGAPRKQTALIIANPDFGESADNSVAGERILKYRPASPEDVAKGTVLAGAYFPPLPGTDGEAKALKTLLPEAEVLLTDQATEAALKKVNAPGILHVATHGFFLNDRTEGGDRGLSLDPDVAARAANPLLRSGLALAGANAFKSGNDDGILTALEAAGLDLWGTRLVVLSACDTGVGEVRNGEGVYGLRRALVLAGAEAQLLSLWPVNDLATRDLMTDFYRRQRRGNDLAEAIRSVQLRMITTGYQKPGRKRVRDYSHPYYWAGFIQSGEWANTTEQR